MISNFTNPVSINHKGKVIYFVSQPTDASIGDKIYYNVLNLQIEGTDNNENWDGYTELSFPEEVSISGINILRVKKKVTNKGFFNVVSDQQYIYVARASSEGLYINRYLLVEVPNPNLSGDTKLVLQPAWEVRYQRSQKPDTPDGEKDTQSYINLEGSEFIEPIQEIPLGSNGSPLDLSDGFFAVQLLPTKQVDALRWQFFIIDQKENILLTYSCKRSENGWFDFDKEQVDFQNKYIKPDRILTFTYQDKALSLDGPPAATIYTKQEPVETNDSTVLQLQQAFRLMMVFQCKDESSNILVGNLDIAIDRDGILAYPDGSGEGASIPIKVGKVGHAPYSLEFNGSSWIHINGDSIVLGDTFTQQLWVYSTAQDVSPKILLGSTDATVKAENRPPSLWISEKYKVGMGFGNGSKFLQMTTVENVLNSNSWNNLIVMYNKGKYTLLVNGSKVDLKGDDFTDAIPAATPLTGIGGNVFGTCNGEMNEVRIWSDLQEEAPLKYLYDRIPENEAKNMTSLDAYYPMDEGIGNIVKSLASNESRTGTISGAIWASSSSPLSPLSSPVSYIDSRGLTLYAGVIIPEPTGRFSQFGDLKDGSRPYLLSSADGYLHFYYQGDNDNFYVAQYDTSNSRAHYGVSWEANSGGVADNQSGEIIFSSRQTGIVFNHSIIDFKQDPTSQLFTIALDDTQGSKETWNGIPGHVPYIIEVLSGTSLNQTNDPRLITGERVYYDYSGTRNQYYQPVGDPLQHGLLQLASRNTDAFVCDNISVKADEGGNTCSVNIKVNIEDRIDSASFNKTFKNVSTEVNEFVNTIVGTSTVYDYNNPKNTDDKGATFYNIPAGSQSILTIIPDPNVSKMKMVISDSEQSTIKEPKCEVKITLTFSDNSPDINATWKDLPRLSAAFIKGISESDNSSQKKVATYLRYYEKSGTLVVQNGTLEKQASLYAMASFLDIFKINANGKVTDFDVKLDKIQSVISEGEVANLQLGSMLFGVFVNGKVDNGFPPVVVGTQSGTLLQPGRDGGWIAESPKFCVEVQKERSAVEVKMDNVLNKPLNIPGSMTLEAWTNVKKLKESKEALDIAYPRLIHSNLGNNDGSAQYMLGITYSTSLQFLKSDNRGPAKLVVDDSKTDDASKWIFGTENSSFSFYIKADLGTLSKGPGSIFQITTKGTEYPTQQLIIDKDGKMTYQLIKDGSVSAEYPMNNVLKDLDWSMISIVREKTKVFLYFDGNSDVNFEVPAYTTSPAKNTLTIAGNETIAFEFECNQIAVWNRSLQPGDVKDRFNQALPQDDERLILLYRLDTYQKGDDIINKALLTGDIYNIKVTGFYKWAYPGVFCPLYASVRDRAVISDGALMSTEAWNHVSAQYEGHYGIQLSEEAFGDCGNEDNLNMETSLSLEAWVCQTKRTEGSGQVILSKFGKEIKDQCYEFGIDGNFKPYLKIRTQGNQTVQGDNVSDTDLYYTITGSDALSLNTVYYCAATVKITSVTKEVTYTNKKDKEVTEKKNVYTVEGQIYVDGMATGNPFKVTDLYGEISINQSKTNVNIGRTKPNAEATEQQYFIGKLSDIRLWNKPLTADNILSNFELVNPQLEGEGLVSAWNFSEQEGRTAFDSESENNALLSNRDLWILFNESSVLRLNVNGKTIPIIRSSINNFGGYQEKQVTFGGMRNNRGAFANTLLGQLNELRIWTEVRTLEQINDNKERLLTGREKQLAGYWRMQGGSGKIVYDNTGRGNDGIFSSFDAEDLPIWNNSEAPIGNESGIVVNALGGLQTKFSKKIITGPTVIEYADSQFNFKKELFSIYKRCYIYVDVNGIVQRETNFKIGDLNQIYLGQVQSKPSLIGFIEGAPPLPSENLTAPYYESATSYSKYNNIGSVKLTESDDTTVAFSSSRQDGSHLTFGIQAGFALASRTDAQALVASTQVASTEFNIGVAFQLSWAIAQSKESGTTYGLSKTFTNSYANTGYWDSPDSDYTKETGERRYIPTNTGYALVQSMTADMYVLFLESTGAMVGYTIIPNLDIPPDKNIIYFPINPKYIKNGTLDGKVGLRNDTDYPEANVERGSYFKPIEAYSLKKKIEKKENDLLALYSQFDAAKRGKAQEESLSGVEDDNPIYNFEDGRPRADLINNYVWTAAGGFYAEKESAMSMRQESYSGSYTFKWALGFATKGKFLFGPGVNMGFYFDVSLLGGTQWTVTVKKSKSTSNKFGLDVSALPNDLLSKYIGPGQPLYTEKEEPGKVDTYRFMSFYLSPEEENFNTFFDKTLPIVDPAWYNLSDDPQAAALREAAANPNPAWRILHRVTYVSRIPPEFQPFPQESDAPKTAKPVNLSANEVILYLVEEALKDNENPDATEIGIKVRKVILEDLVKSIPWWKDFLEAAKVDNSYENITLANLITDTIQYFQLYYETKGDD